MRNDLPLGRSVDYPTTYAPEVLRAIPRADSRSALGITTPLPFIGDDVWHAWELTWLSNDGRPAVSAVVLSIPADSACIVESKSLKLYLNSFAMSKFDSSKSVQQRISEDVSAVVQAPVTVTLVGASAAELVIQDAEGDCIDLAPAVFTDLASASAALQADSSVSVSEELYSELFRSLCPVTAQPDFATISIAYRGARMERGRLLAYLAAFREHQDFHEGCVERIFTDLQRACAPEALCVSARFLRRGGIDINPWRASGDVRCATARLWRQ